MPALNTIDRPVPRLYTGTRVRIIDLFCGAGGSSEGAEWAGGEVILAANHWKTAIEVHQDRHPETRHDCADISQVNFRRYPSADILIGSPECTNHAQAKGVSRKKQDANLFNQDFDPEAERSRATMWDMVRAAETMAMRGEPFKAIVVENVVEVTSWALYPSWLMAMTEPVAGVKYDYRVLSHNSMHHGVPQSRDRVYFIFTLKGLKPNLELELDAWCDTCDDVRVSRQAFRPGRRVGRYKRQYHYCCTVCHSRVDPPVNPALGIIDFDIPTQLIRERKKPLASATMRRIETGLVKYGPDRFIHQAAGNVFQRPGSTCRSKPLTDPLGAQTTTVQHALIDPSPDEQPDGFLVQTGHTGGPKRPFEDRTRSLDEPHPTVAASDDRQSLVTYPFMVQSHGKDSPSRTRSVEDPAYTATASGVPGLVQPPDGTFLVKNFGGIKDAKHMSVDINGPTGSITGVDHHALVVPMRNHGQAAPAATEPINTVSAGGNHHGLLVPNNTNNVPTPLEQPAGTMTTGNRHGLLLPYYSRSEAQPVTRPVPAVTTVDTCAVINPVLVDPLDCGFRMLDPSEVARAMAFPEGYIPTTYTKRERVKLAGNAVTPPVMCWVIGRLIQMIEQAA